MFSLSIARRFTPYVASLGSPAFRRRVLELIPHKQVQKLKNIVDIMSNRASQIYDEKKRGLQAGDEAVLHQVGEGKDIMSILSAFLWAKRDTRLLICRSEGQFGSIRRGQTSRARACLSDDVSAFNTIFSRGEIMITGFEEL